MKRIIVLPEELQVVVDRLEKIEMAVKKDHKNIDDPILGTQDVMNLLKVSRRCLQGWRDMGLIEYSAINGKFYYRLSAINELLAKHIKKAGGVI